MDDFTESAQAVQLGLALIALLLAIRFILRPALVELFRQRVFELRRAMFVDYVDGKINTEDGYRFMVRRMNSLIRYADHVTFGRALVGAIVLRNAPSEPLIAFDGADETTKKILTAYRKKLNYETSRYALMTSPLMWILLLGTFPLVVLALVVMSLLSMIDVLRAIVARTVAAFGQALSVERLVSDASELLSEELRDSQPRIA